MLIFLPVLPCFVEGEAKNWLSGEDNRPNWLVFQVEFKYLIFFNYLSKSRDSSSLFCFFSYVLELAKKESENKRTGGMLTRTGWDQGSRTGNQKIIATRVSLSLSCACRFFELLVFLKATNTYISFWNHISFRFEWGVMILLRLIPCPPRKFVLHYEHFKVWATLRKQEMLPSS